ncbi:hypothetical protein C1646_729666 [Rhizophagus diaphanus]|nr:hypothetical protein C1646_729666 [Rhizophagus diaphanus] [Rhizophagus sp. MUCL 43196]
MTCHVKILQSSMRQNACPKRKTVYLRERDRLKNKRNEMLVIISLNNPKLFIHLSKDIK